MTVETVASTRIANLFAAPKVIAGEGLQGASVKVIKDSVAVATTSLDDVGDIILLAAVPTKLRLHSLKLINSAALDSNASKTLTINLGLYTFDGTTATAVSASLFGSALNTLQSANAEGAELLFAGSLNASALSQDLFAAAGVATDPGGLYYIGMAVAAAAATASAQTVGIKVEGTIA